MTKKKSGDLPAALIDAHSILAIDGRRLTAKRFRELVAAFAQDLGGEATLTSAEAAPIRQAAVVTVFSHQVQIEAASFDFSYPLASSSR